MKQARPPLAPKPSQASRERPLILEPNLLGGSLSRRAPWPKGGDFAEPLVRHGCVLGDGPPHELPLS